MNSKNIILRSVFVLCFSGVAHAQVELRCVDVNDRDGSKKVTIRKQNDTFDVAIHTKDDSETIAGLRPSLNVRIQDIEPYETIEFVDFHPAGLETVPVGAKDKLEIELSSGILWYAKDTSSANLKCRVETESLLSYLGVLPRSKVDVRNIKAVGFDIDDTLVFSTPTFRRSMASGGTPSTSDRLFWTLTNGCDAGCPEETITLPDGSRRTLPANIPSPIKAKALELVRFHREQGHNVYVITARPEINGEPLRQYISKSFGISPDHVFFEPDLEQTGNPAGKTDRIESLNLDIFYGDADSDMTDAENAFKNQPNHKKVKPIRFMRAPNSSNRKNGQLNKYHPGYFGEPILKGSY
jgi:acid phosphatase class B